MAKVLITLLGILLLLNAMTFLLVAFQDPGGEATAEDGAATSAALTALTAKVDNLTRKMGELSRLKTTITKHMDNSTRTLKLKIDALARAHAAALRTAPPRAIPAANGEDEEEEPEDEEEAIEREGGQG